LFHRLVTIEDGRYFVTVAKGIRNDGPGVAWPRWLSLAIGVYLCGCRPDLHSDAGTADAIAHSDTGASEADVADVADASHDGGDGCAAVLCDDFEHGLSPAVWTVDAYSNAVVEVQSDRVAHGRSAAHFRVDTSGGSAFITNTTAPAALPDHIYGRAYLYVSPDTNGPHTDFFEVLTTDASRLWELQISAGGSALGINYVWWNSDTGAGPMSGEAPNGLGPMPANVWLCLSWEWVRTPQLQTNVWVSGISSGGQAYVNSPPYEEPFHQLRFGINQFAARSGSDLDVYIDDVVLDRHPIGCLP
jgi:hypothetical protein